MEVGYVAEDDLGLPIPLPPPSKCAGVTGMNYHAREAPYQLNCSPAPTALFYAHQKMDDKPSWP